jgi:hypothetical protein
MEREPLSVAWHEPEQGPRPSREAAGSADHPSSLSRRGGGGQVCWTCGAHLAAGDHHTVPDGDQAV